MTPDRVLVIMLRRIGDVLLTGPAVRSLRRMLPNARIDFLVEPPAHQVLAGNPDISHVLVYGGPVGPPSLAPSGKAWAPRGGLPAGSPHSAASGRALRPWCGVPCKGFRNYIYWLRRIRRARYDWVIDYMGNPRTAVLTFASRAPLRAGPAHVSHRWAYTDLMRQPSETCYSALEKVRMLRSLGVRVEETEPLPRLAPEAVDRAFADDALRYLEPLPGPLVGFAPASRRLTRRWPAASYAALGRSLRDRNGASLLVFWGPGERDLARQVRDEIGSGAHLSPETSDLRRLAGLMARCRMLVTNCNGPKHMAVALGVPTLTIHASSDPRAWNPPDDPLHPAVRLEELDCIGCRSNACPRSLECLRDLPPERVYAAAEALLAAAGRPTP